MKSLDDIQCHLSMRELEKAVRGSLPSFTFKGGDSDYRGFHLDGKNESGTEFSIEQLSQTVPYAADLWVKGEDREEVDLIFEVILKILRS